MPSEEDDSRIASNKGWFTPARLLWLFCAMNMLVYMDRGVISSNGVNGARGDERSPGYGIQGDFELSLTQIGYLPAAFLVGLLVSSPIFAEASKHVNAFRLIALGLGVWTLSTAGCGISVGFWSLIICRMFVGVGEASFVALASPFIDDNAPPQSKTRWLATFYLCIPVGYALGYIFGGVVAGPLGWRAAFLLEAAAMAPFVAFCALAPPIHLRGMSKEADRSPAAVAADMKGPREWGTGLVGAVKEAASDLVTVCRHPVYVCTIGGQTLYTAFIGAIAYLGPKAGRDVFGISGETADLVFGAVTVLTGVFGTLAGGVLLDRMGSTMGNALTICAAGMAFGAVLIILAFGVTTSLLGFVPPFAAGQFAIFGIQAPNTAVVLWSVPARLRPFAMSLQVIVIHVLGDVPSPVILGWLQERLQNWRISIGISALLLLLGALVFYLGKYFSSREPDYRTLSEFEDAEAARDAEPETPLLRDADGASHM
ncbi:g3483 [Coccomyxa elongata]